MQGAGRLGNEGTPVMETASPVRIKVSANGLQFIRADLDSRGKELKLLLRDIPP